MEVWWMPKHRTWPAYYLALVKQCGKECWRTWRGEVLASVISSVFLYLINRSGVDMRTALLATGYTVSAFVLWHLIRVPWILYQKLDEAEHLKPIWGLVGSAFIAATLFLIAFAAAWFWELQPRVDLTRIPDGRDIRIVQLESRINELTPVPPPSNSLRHRTIKLVNEINLFWADKSVPTQQPIPNPATDADRAHNAKLERDWKEVTLAYKSKQFNERVLGIAKQYLGKGVSVGYLERSAEQPDRLIGALPYGGFSLDNCEQFMSELCQLRELAFHVDAYDERVDASKF
jgi:hypothetical protein